MSLSDAERDALEQLQEAIENGDLSLLRKLLKWSRALRLFRPGTYSFECSALFRRRRVETRGALRENTYTQPPSQGVATPGSPWVSSSETKLFCSAGQTRWQTVR